jgi:acylphosphatase
MASMAKEPDPRRARVTVSGHVHGVGFRYAALARARSLQVGGWVQNLPDGKVEAVFEGDPDRVESMVEWCRRGPGGAVVEDVTVAWEDPVGESEFDVR